MANLLKKHNEKLAGMYTTTYKEPTVEDVLSKVKGSKISSIRIDSRTSELVIETSKGDIVLGCEMDNGDAVIVKGFIK